MHLARKADLPRPMVMIVAVTLLLSILFFLLSLLTGKYPLTLTGLWQGEAQMLQVFYTLRLPRTLMALCGGFGLGVAGMVFQTVFRNPLAAPDIIGVTSGASTGAAFAILFLPAGTLWRTGSAFLGGILAVLLALLVSALLPHGERGTLVLSGIVVQSLAQTLLMLLKLTADPEKQLASIEYWTMGSLNGITLSKLPFPMLLTGICLLFLFALHRQLMVLSLEDAESKLLGMSVQRMRILILLLATMVVAAIICVTGPISFIGLLAPHIARLLTGHHRPSTFFLSGLCGGSLLLLADILARSVAASELPVSIFTSLLGAPFLLYLLLRKERRA